MQQARSPMAQVGVLVRRGAAPVLAPRVTGRARDATPCADACTLAIGVSGLCHSTRQALVLYHNNTVLTYNPVLDAHNAGAGAGGTQGPAPRVATCNVKPNAPHMRGAVTRPPGIANPHG